MKDIDEVLAAVARRLDRSWHREIAGYNQDWPHPFPLGVSKGAELATDYMTTYRQAEVWRQWAESNRATLIENTRDVDKARQPLPTHLRIANVDAAAALAGAGWPDLLSRGRTRSAQVTSQFPELADPPAFIRASKALPDHDFAALLQTGQWFRDHADQARGLTPRQVPIPGIHGKWLKANRDLVATLAGLGSAADLGLLPPHPPRIHFTYLDPAYRASGRRRHDSATVGDTAQPAYQPTVVIISENKDTAIHFPPLSGGVSVEGVGAGGSTIAAVDWIRNCPLIVYWGDMDPDGLEILAGFRAAGLAAVSLLMDPAAYDTWERFGTNTDAKGRPLQPREPRPAPHLTGDERDLYTRLCSPEWTRHRRVEQERIPLAEAMAHLRTLIHVHPQASGAVELPLDLPSDFTLSPSHQPRT